MTLPSPSARPLPVRLDVPDAFRRKAHYALSELLFGLGLAPVDDAAPALVYGPAPVSGALHLPFDPAAAAQLGNDPAASALDPAQGGELDVDGQRVPLAFGTADAPDLVATAFAWLSGWGEASAPRDAHGRVPFDASWTHRLGLPADLPVVDVLRQHLAAQLRAHGIDVPGRTVGGATGALALTCDVDALYRVRPGIFKQVFFDGLVRNRDRVPFAERLRRADRLLGDAMRPGDPYLFDLAWLADTFAPHGGGTFFVKADASHRAFDTPVDLDDDALKALAAAGHELAVHPSYDAHGHAGRLTAERAAFQKAFPQASAAVRHHYLRFDPLETPARLEGAGFVLDSTLGWSETPGFRRGTAHPFRLYDLAADRATALWEVPLVLMDVSLRGRSGAEVAGETARLLGAVQRTGGVAAMLWHNTLSAPDANPLGTEHVAATLAAAQGAGLRLGPVSALLGAWMQAG